MVQGGVHFQGDDRLLYQSLLWSRLASRILLPLNEFRVHSDLDLYLGVQAIDWPSIFGVDKTFAVHFSGVNEEIRNSQYGALKVKDAIVDSFTRKLDQRPTVAKQQPDIRVNVFLQRDMASVALDLSGEGLHQRGYRDLTGQAPLKENLAAAIVLRSGWQPGTPMLDPMCGSGTLLIEAAMIAADRAPGLHRQHWGFSAWNGHNAELWREVTAEAQVRARRGLQETASRFFGSDIDRRVIEMARGNARRAGVAELITFNVGDVARLTNPLPEGPHGTVISNPPYGERLESEPALIALHNMLGRVMVRLRRLATVAVQRLAGAVELPAAARRAPVREERPAGVRAEKLSAGGEPGRRHYRRRAGGGRFRQPSAQKLEEARQVGETAGH